VGVVGLGEELLVGGGVGGGESIPSSGFEGDDAVVEVAGDKACDLSPGKPAQPPEVREHKTLDFRGKVKYPKRLRTVWIQR